MNQDKIKRLTNKIKNLANKIHECRDEMERYSRRYGATYEELNHYYTQVKKGKMKSEAFKAKTGYAPSAVEAALENMQVVVDRLERIQHTLPIPIDSSFELNDKIVTLEETILADKAQADQGEPAPRRLDRQEARQLEPRTFRPHSRGRPRPDEGRREKFEYTARLQVLHLCNLVDPPVHQPRDRRPGPHHPHPGAHEAS